MDQLKHRQLQSNFNDACARIRELSEFILKLKKAQFEYTPKLAIYGARGPDFIEIVQIPKTDFELLNKWKNLINDFNL